MHNIKIKTERLLLRPLTVADAGSVMEKCGLHFAGYGEFQKLDGSCKMRSMEYEGEI